MITAVLNGRLGNWLFQYAAARSLALDRSTDVSLEVSRYTSWRHPFAGPVRRALGFFSLQARYTRGNRHAAGHSENGWGYDPRFHELPGATSLRGYFQSPRYWRGHEATIRADLQPSRLPGEREFESLVSDIEHSVSVALHVRRGDYLTTERELHFVCTDAYYAQALDHIRERVSDARVFVFSDDPAWCRSRYTDSAQVVELAASQTEPGLDLHLMSRCKHHIISNSTYSWWGAWLGTHGGQIVCAPERWFNDDAMNALAMRDTVPAAWHRIPLELQPA
ncbi:MAG TPA: alpha-1,2-fucosyltransferase [Burkholderiales bacterium]|nr:alpha-1,2-fucosyltransferase [Burkholderiales bacterium]